MVNEINNLMAFRNGDTVWLDWKSIVHFIKFSYTYIPKFREQHVF